MLKKRLIFILYYSGGDFFLSRNFRLQRVGDVRWLIDKFRFKSIGKYIDEIIVLDVTRESYDNKTSWDYLANSLTYLMKETFVPLTIGGGLRSAEQVSRCFEMGADKVLFNTPLITQPELVRECVVHFGAQAVVASIDVISSQGIYLSRITNGELEGLALVDHINKAVNLGVGEIIINSIDQDGTGTGFDMNLVRHSLGRFSVPLIIAGGAGKPEHFSDVLAIPGIDAAATGNLFNFIGKGFERVRSHLLERGLPVRSATQ